MRNFAILAFIAFVGAATASTIETKFQQWVAEHGRSYGTVEEYMFRLARFAELDTFIEDQNSKGESYILGHNHMSDWTRAEYERLLTHKPYLNAPEDREPVPAPVANGNETYNNTVDWVTAGAVTPVGSQMDCGSGWAFSSTGGMEGIYQIAYGTLVAFSKQQLLDCDIRAYGCYGGSVFEVYTNYAVDNPMYNETQYPYTGGYFNMTCRTPDQGPTNMTTNGSRYPDSSNVTALKEALHQQPVSVAVDAHSYAFQSYKSGIFNSIVCGTTCNQPVLLVGWGKEETYGIEYWILKNSYGKQWGEEGYMYIQIVQGDGICGVQKEPSYPILPTEDT